MQTKSNRILKIFYMLKWDPCQVKMYQDILNTYISKCDAIHQENERQKSPS